VVLLELLAVVRLVGVRLDSSLSVTTAGSVISAGNRPLKMAFRATAWPSAG
jgi:hypothetical protein